MSTEEEQTPAATSSTPDAVSGDNAEDADGVVSSGSLRAHYGQALLTVDFKSLKVHHHSESEHINDDRGEFFFVINGKRWPQEGEIYMKSHEVYKLPGDGYVTMFSKMVDVSLSKAEINSGKTVKKFPLEVLINEKDPLKDDKLLRIKEDIDLLPTADPVKDWFIHRDGALAQAVIRVRIVFRDAVPIAMPAPEEKKRRSWFGGKKK